MASRFDYYTDILRHTRKAPLTFEDIAKACKRPNSQPFRYAVKFLHIHRLMRIGGYTKRDNHWFRLFQYGEGDEPYPGNGNPWAREFKIPEIKYGIQFVAMWKEIVKESVCAVDLADQTDVPYETTLAFLKSCHKAKLIYIRSWERPQNNIERGPWAAVWAIRKSMNQLDCKRPDKISAKETSRSYRERKKARLQSVSVFTLGASYAFSETGI